MMVKDSCKVCHQSLVRFDPSIVSQIGRVLVGVLLIGLCRFVSVMAEVVCKAPVVVDIR